MYSTTEVFTEENKKQRLHIRLLKNTFTCTQQYCQTYAVYTDLKTEGIHGPASQPAVPVTDQWKVIAV
jgi:hypothetical protein